MNLFEVEAVGLQRRKQRLNRPAFGILGWGVSAIGITGDEQPLALFQALGAEVECLSPEPTGFAQHPLLADAQVLEGAQHGGRSLAAEACVGLDAQADWVRDSSAPASPPITCDSCAAACCRLEVLCLTDGDIPERFTTLDDWGGTVMARLEDGWCAALNRDSLRCRIYAQRPLGCREFALGSDECLSERAAKPTG